MPNRILRDWTDSESIDLLTAQGERFFTRLIMKVDDYGRYTSNIKLLKSTLFPLKTDIREADISLWLTECEKCGLIALYTVAQKGYLQISNFKQTLRTKTGKYPPPEECLSCAKQMHSNFSADAPLKGNETKQNLETESETKAKAPAQEFLILEPDEIKRRLIEYEYEVRLFVCQSYRFSDSDFIRAVEIFIGEKTSGTNELEKDYAEVIRQFKSWVKFHREKLLKQFNQKNNGTGKQVSQPWRQQPIEG